MFIKEMEPHLFLSGINEIFTFSMHCEKKLPFLKQNSDLDVPLDEFLTDGWVLY